MESAAGNQWTQFLQVQWRPTLNFFERKMEFLRAMERAKLLRSFKVQEESISARLGSSVRLQILPSRLHLFNYDPSQPAPAAGGLEAALQIIAPHVVAATTAHQYLHELDVTYDDARTAGCKSLFGDLTSELRSNDFALLLDGQSSVAESVYQAEIGIVKGHEVPGRLARDIGRIGAGWLVGDNSGISRLLQRRTVPDVALFVDIKHMAAINEADPHKAFSSVLAFADGARDEGRQFTKLWHDRISSFIAHSDESEES